MADSNTVILKRWQGEPLNGIAYEAKEQLQGGKLVIVTIEVKTSIYDDKHRAHTVGQIIDSRWHLRHVCAGMPVIGALAFGDNGNNVCSGLPEGVDLAFRFKQYDEALVAQALGHTLEYNLLEPDEREMMIKARRLGLDGQFQLQHLFFVSNGAAGAERQRRIIGQYFGDTFFEVTHESRGMMMESYVLLELCRAIEQLRGYRTTLVTGVYYGALVSNRVVKKSEIDILAFTSSEVIHALADGRSTGMFTVEKSPDLEVCIGF